MRDALNTKRTYRYVIGTILTGKAVRTADDLTAIAAYVAAGALTSITAATFGLFDSPVADDSCSITSGAAVLTSPNNPWTSADVGKAIDVQGAGTAGATLRSRIKTYNSAGSVTLWDNAGTTVAALVSSAGGLAVWGNDLTQTRTLPVRPNEAGTSESSVAAETVIASGSPTGRTLASRLSDMLGVKDFGAVGDGTTDDTTAMQLAITTAAAAGTVLYLDPGTYRIRSQLLLASGLSLTGPGKVYLDPASYLDKAIRALGIEGAEINLTVNVAAGDKTITMASTTGLSAGQMVLLRANTLTNKWPQEALEIESLNATTVTFRTPIVATYLTADTARIVPITPKSDITLDGVWIDCSATSDIGYLVSMEYVRNVRISGCKITGHRTTTTPDSQSGFLINSALNARVVNCQGQAISGNGNFASFVYGSQFAAIGNQSLGYAFGIGAFYGTHVELAGNSVRGIRANGNRGIKVSAIYGGAITGNIIAGFDSGIKDEDSRDITIIGNVVEQCCFDSTGSGINVSNQIATTNEAATHVIANNIVRGMLGVGILVDVGSYHAVISGNLVENTQGRGIIANAQQVAVTGNFVRNWGQAYVGANDHLFSGIYVDRAASVVGNRGHNTLTTVPFIALSANATRSTVEVVAMNSCSTNDILWVAAATGVLNGTAIGATGVNMNDPQRRWVGSVGGATQPVTMTNTQTFTTTCFADGMLFSVALGSGKAALFFACFNSATITLLSDPSALFSITSGTANKFNVSKGAASGVITFQNLTTATVTCLVAFLGTRLTATTDPA